MKIPNKKVLRPIPYFFTFANAFFGFLSVIYSLDGNIVSAVYCIFCAAIMDGFDGRLARLLGTSSSLGMELDSLCDAISFCFAPAVLLYSSFLYDQGFIGISVLVFYLCAGLFRLAKFNMSSELQVFSFLGLPTTVAAFFLSSLVLYYDRVDSGPLGFLIHGKTFLILIAFVAMLMISSIPFPALKKFPRDVRHLFVKLIICFILAFLVFLQGIPILFMLLLIYIFVGFATGSYLYAHNFFTSRR